MAHENITYLDWLVTAPDAADNSFGISAPLGDNTDNIQTFTVEVVSGSIQICVGQAVGANSPVHAEGDKFVVSNVNRRTIYYKAAAGGNTFIVGF
jgi:hypothetical protein